MEVYKDKGKYKIDGSFLIGFRVKLEDLKTVEKILREPTSVTVPLDQGMVTGQYLFSCVFTGTTKQEIIDLVDKINLACAKNKE